LQGGRKVALAASIPRKKKGKKESLRKILIRFAQKVGNSSNKKNEKRCYNKKLTKTG
jgi:hypothetical protein